MAAHQKSHQKIFRFDCEQDQDELFKIMNEDSDLELESGDEETDNGHELAQIQISPILNILGDDEDDLNQIETQATDNYPSDVDIQQLNCLTSSVSSAQTRSLLWKDVSFTPAPDSDESPTETETAHTNCLAIDYFRRYFDDGHFENAAKYTNMYALSKDGIELNTTLTEIKILYGAHLYFGCIPLPRLTMYWQKRFRQELIASKISRNRLFSLRKYLHYVDTNVASDGSNVLWKVQPIIDDVRKRCLAIPRIGKHFSIDEQMIPFLGKCPRPLRQYVKNKPRPVGLKNFVITTSSGLVLDFEIYQGSTTRLPERKLGLGPSVVLRLAESIPQKSFLFFDRYFTTIPLLDRLNELNIYGTGTIQVNRIRNIKFPQDTIMKRGEAIERTRSDHKVVTVKWKDSNCVTMASTAYGRSPLSIVKRWSKIDRKYIEVPCPKVIVEYNKKMGGVDICDQMIEYYRSWIKSRKWTLKVAIHFVDLAVVNSWMEYRQDCLNAKIPKNKIKHFFDFRLEIAEALLLSSPKRTLEESDEETPTKKYTNCAPHPGDSVRLDGLEHWPVMDNLKTARACRLNSCNKRTRGRCEKCNVHLCLTQGSYFKDYHINKT